MNRAQRDRRASLDTILRRHTQHEEQTLNDLRKAGIRVSSIAAARRMQDEQREQTQIIADAIDRLALIEGTGGTK